MTDTEDFLRRWHAFVRGYTVADPDARAALVERVLTAGLDDALAGLTDVIVGDDAADALVDPADRMQCEYDLVDASGIFREQEYMWHNRELHWYFCRHHEGLRHFIRDGWPALRNPSSEFDLWWYWFTYLDPADDQVNPVVHYLAEGRHLGHATLPPVHPVREPPAAPGPGGLRRACLFAGFDGDGLIDDTVVDYVRELSRFADVFYLADCALEDGEIDKLAPYTKQRWAIRHGRYDFGTYSLLARDLVGWDELATYDEVLLANDSVYLLRSLDEVFATMDARPAHWWGLQATHDPFRPGDQDVLGRRLRVEDLVAQARTERPWRISDCFHVGSYFMALRADIIADPEFRRRLDTVAGQREKNSIIRKYEIGISSYLTLAGYHVETFVEGVLPFHPIYRESAFHVMEEGFPFIKRQFLHENPFHVPDLDHWKDRVHGIYPDADLGPMDDNLWRVSPTYNIHRALDIHTLPNGVVEMPELVMPDTFDDLERWVPRFDHWWVFPVNPRTGRLDGHARAVFEAVRHDPTIKKILIAPTENPGIGGANVAVVLGQSQGAQWYLLRAGVVFVNEGPRADLPHPLPPRKHRFVDVGHASALRAFGAAVPHIVGDAGLTRHRERLHDLDLTRAVCASSEVHAEAIRPSTRSKTRPKRWVTGSPRADLLLAAEDSLAPDLRAQLGILRRARAARRLVVWAPADRGSAPVPTPEPARLRALVERARERGAVLAVRPPRRDRPSDPIAGLDPAVLREAGLLVLSHRTLPDTEMVLRETAVLVSDYTDDLVDYLVLDRPVAAYVPDLERVVRDPGLVQDLADVVPGPVCRTWEELEAAYDGLLDEPSRDRRERHAVIRDRQHLHVDGRSALRVARRVQATYLPLEEWLEEPVPQA